MSWPSALNARSSRSTVPSSGMKEFGSGVADLALTPVGLFGQLTLLETGLGAEVPQGVAERLHLPVTSGICACDAGMRPRPRVARTLRAARAVARRQAAERRQSCPCTSWFIIRGSAIRHVL
jgi:hypothetical protein